MNGDSVTVAVEVCSGPLDGTGVQVAGGSFTVGYRFDCDISLPGTLGLPEKAVVRARLEPGGGLLLESECDLEYAGTRTRTVRGGDAVIVRVGATDLAVSVAAQEEEPAGAAGAGEAPGDRKQCAICGWENAAGARWCSNCGRDL